MVKICFKWFQILIGNCSFCRLLITTTRGQVVYKNNNNEIPFQIHWNKFPLISNNLNCKHHLMNWSCRSKLDFSRKQNLSSGNVSWWPTIWFTLTKIWTQKWLITNCVPSKWNNFSFAHNFFMITQTCFFVKVKRWKVKRS